MVCLHGAVWRVATCPSHGEGESVDGDQQCQPSGAEQPGEDHVGQPVVAEERRLMPMASAHRSAVTTATVRAHLVLRRRISS